MSSSTVSRKDIGSLKRPDLKGMFLCGSCGQEFMHSASLNRHRLLAHSSEHHCMICKRNLRSDENIRSHFRNEHCLQVYTCGCCNWTFPAKKLLTDHCKSINETGDPGPHIPIAKCDKAPGSLLQSAIQGTPKVNKPTKRRRQLSTTISPNTSASQSSSSSRSSSNSPPPVTIEKQLNFIAIPYHPKMKTMEEAVDFILQGNYLNGDQITLPESWEKIVNTAILMMIASGVENPLVQLPTSSSENKNNNVKKARQEIA